MLLAVDIGNTNISFGIFKSDRMVKGFSIPTKNYRILKLNNKLSGVRIEKILICSVVPRVTKILSRDLKRIFRKQPYILGKDLTVPIRNLYRNPKKVGQDRLVNAYAGAELYGTPLVVVDFGTAITFDLVSKHKEYLGGMIVPGLEISLAALAQNTALLPKIKLKAPGEFIGGDTKAGILSGVVYGFAALTDGLVERIRKGLGKNAKVIGTGGDASFMSRYSLKLDRVDRDLTLKGLNLIHQKQKNS